MSSTSPVTLQLGEVAPSRIWRTCASLSALALVALVLTILNMGFVRVSRERFYDFEWQNGWPWVYLGRHAGIDVTRQDPEAWIPDPTQALLWFRPAAAIADASLALALLGATWWAIRRRFRSPRPFQYGMRGLLLLVTAVSAVFGWGLYHDRRQRKVVEATGNIFGFYVDQGLPQALRQFLPGGRLRLFDRIRMVNVAAPDCRGDRLKLLAELDDATMVEIWSNEVDDDSVRHLTRMHRLVGIRLRGPTHVSDAGLKHISKLKKLRELDIGSSRITDAGLVHLAELKQLEHLDLNQIDEISDAGLAHLHGLKALKTLELMRANITDAGLDQIADLTRLEWLGLAETSITDDGLAKLSNLKSLKLLDVRNTAVTKQGLARFKLAHPGCRWIR